MSDARAEVLVLGSMPGKASLRANQYYAHPRNAFWPIFDEIFGIRRSLPYAQRCARLMQRRIAVWDVLKTCTRTSSLDSDIDPSSIEPNDFQTFFVEHPRIRAVYFNGALAEKMFNRYVLPSMSDPVADIPMVRLPSTSPANASYSFRQKLAQWRVLAG
jgi:TDG/mug DNA glycosylase family protein